MNKLFYRLLLLSLCLLFLAQGVVLAQKSKNKKKNSRNNEAVLSKDQPSSSDAEYLLVEGMKYFILEKYSRALDNFQKALSISSESSSIQYKIAETYFRMKDYAQAELYARKALQKETANKYYYILLAKIYAEQQKYNEAKEIYLALIQNISGSEEYYYELAEIYQLEENFEKAIESYNQVEATFGVSESVISKKQELYLNMKQVDQAISEGQKLVQIYPGEVRYQIKLADLYIYNSQNAEARSLLESIQKENNSDARVNLLLAKIYQQEGNLNLSHEQLKTAFANPDLEADQKINILVNYMKGSEASTSTDVFEELARTIVLAHPAHAKSHTLYGDILLLKNQKEQALDYYIKASQLESNLEAKTWRQILALEADQNQLDSLVKHAEKALELYPNQALFWYYLGAGQLGQENYDGAVLAAEEGKRLAFSNQELQNDFGVLLGDAYGGLEQYQEADLAFENVLENSPNNVRALNNYSYSLALRKEKLNRAKELSARLVEQYPNQAAFLDTHGWVLFQSKEYKKAVKFLEKASQLSKDGSVHEHYGDVLFKLGDKEKALQQWQKAEAAGGASKQIKKKIADKKLYE